MERSFEQNIDDFRPFFDKSVVPNIEIESTEISSVFIYNKDYVENFLFKSDDIANNSYSLIAKTFNFEEQINSINALLNQVKKTIVDKQIASLIQDFEKIDISIKFNVQNKKTGFTELKGSSTFGKSFKDGIKQEISLNERLSKYSAFKGILNWIDWISQGISIVNESSENLCPFCSKEISIQELEDIKTIPNLGNTKKFENNKFARNALVAISAYCNNDIRGVILEYCNSKLPSSKVDATKLKDSLNLIRDEIEKIKSWDSFGAITASNIEKDSLAKRLKDNFVNLEIFDGAREELLVSLTAYNRSIEKLENEATNLIQKLSKLNSAKKRAIAGFKTEINQFLELSGIPYEMSIELSDDLAFTHLRYKGTDKDIPNIKNALSYGEFNAIALCLFALEAAGKENCLIVLDDPISSYDSEKRAAILISLFCEKQTKLSLKGKTVLILTHDFETLVPFFKWPRLNAKEFVIGWHLISNNNELTQQKIDSSSIKNTAVLEKESAQNLDLPFLIRIVHLRKYFQLVDGDGDEFEFLSCLTHEDENHTQPAYKRNGEYIKMPKEVVKQVETKLYEFLGNGNFNEWKAKIDDDEALLDLYKNESNGFNKLVIARQIIKGHLKNDAEWSLVKTYITETYHVDSEHIFGFANQYDNVPNYILEICDKIVHDINSRKQKD